MSTSIVEEPLSTSYEFCDAKKSIIVTLYANGAYEVKDIDISVETDSLEVRTPANERWLFSLWEHIYSDQVEIQTQINAAQTQTSIEIRLIKQQPRKTWPQLYSNNSKPITPQRDEPMDQFNEMNSTNIQYYDVSWKKIKHDFFESNDTFTASVYIKQVEDFNIFFTETNFTATFHTNDENFLTTHSISSDRLIRLFVRVKERIKPMKCSHRLTTMCIEIKLYKDNPNSMKWDCLEPNEYLVSRPILQPTTSSESPKSNQSLSINSTLTNSNKAIPLPPPYPSTQTNRQPEKYPTSSVFTSSIQQKLSSSSSSSTTFGFTGIYNPANSCFMNAAIQCLSNTRELRDYFLQRNHLFEINPTNPLGMKGDVAREFGELINGLWSGKHDWINAQRLRNFAAKRHQEFVGHGQHDAQELLTILLDVLHEDLNRIINKPQVPPIEDQGRLDHIVADEYWRGYLSRNDSIIVQLFTGQFKSKTKCPKCHKESIAFDPFTTLSVPLPKRTAIDTIVLYRNDQKPSIKYRIIITADGLVSELKRNLSIKCGLASNKMLAYKVRTNRSIEYLKDEDRLTSSGYSLNSIDLIYIAETLTSAECNNEPIIHLTFTQRIFKVHDFVSSCGYCQAPPNPHSSLKYCQICYQTFYCDEKCQKFHAQQHKISCGSQSSENYETIGIPFIISLPQSKLTCKNVFEQVTKYAKRSVDIHTERSKRNHQSFRYNHDYNRINNDFDDDRMDNGDDDSFSDVENVDWPTIKKTLSSSDSWSICRIGDYFIKKSKKRRRHHENENQNHKEKFIKNNQGTMISNSDSSSSAEELDILDEIYRNQPLFRLMPYISNTSNCTMQPIVEADSDADKILRCSTTFSIDWFTDNTVEAPLRILPSKNRNGINGLIEDDSVYTASADQEITLQQCLQMFIEPEVLSSDDKWYCPNCKEHMQAEKIMSLWRLPPVLIIHLKRFKYYHGSAYGYFSDSRMKIDTNVKYPVHDLDMSPYCSSKGNSSKVRYDLFGVVNHRGSAWFGHYTSYARLLAYNDSAKTEIGWRNFDDERVSVLAHDKDLVRSDAYVLFYRHRNLPVHLNVNQQTSLSPMSVDINEDTVTMKSSTMRDIHDLIQ